MKQGRYARWIPLVIVAAGVLVHLGSLRGAFVFDDLRTLERSALRVSGQAADMRMARPVVDWTFDVNYRVSRGKAADYHLVNLLLHIVTALVLYGLLRRVAVATGASAQRGTCLAGVTALLWCVHPLTTSAVTYISQRYEVAMSLCYLVTLYAALRGMTTTGHRRALWFGGTLLACLVGMGCKEVMVTAPAAVAVMAWVLPGARESRQTVRDRGLLIAGLCSTWGALALLMSWRSQAAAPEAYVASTSVWYYALTQPGVLLHYVRLALIPVDQCFDYAWPLTTTLGAALLPGVAVGVLVVLTGWGVVRRKAWALAPAVALLILAPTSSFVPRPDPLVEHRMYLPLAGIVLIGVMGVEFLRRNTSDGRAVRIGSGVLLICTAVALGLQTMRRNEVYREERTLWADVVAKRPDNLRGRVALAAALLHNGNTVAAEAQLLKVLEGLEGPQPVGRPVNTLRAQANNNLGVIRDRQGRYEAAETAFRAALAAAPDYAQAAANLKRVLQKKKQPR